jgi:hypothetical protein
MIHAFYVELLLALSLRRSRVKLVAGTRLSSSLSSVNQIVVSVEEVCPRAVERRSWKVYMASSKKLLLHVRVHSLSSSSCLQGRESVIRGSFRPSELPSEGSAAAFVDILAWTTFSRPTAIPVTRPSTSSKAL